MANTGSVYTPGANTFAGTSPMMGVSPLAGTSGLSGVSNELAEEHMIEHQKLQQDMIKQH
jgi:hypothetical protein